MRLRFACLSLATVAAAACSSDSSPIQIHTTSANAPALTLFAAALPGVTAAGATTAAPAAHVSTDDDPVKALSAGPGIRVAAVSDLAGCKDCYRVEKTAAGYVVHGDGVLGLQYGLASLLESAGFQFHHPLRPSAPSTIAPPSTIDTAMHAAERSLRGIHLHTLHPVEGYFAYWEDGALDDVKRTHAWIAWNRGNYVEWVALADVESDSPRQMAWRARTKQIVDDAHARGLRVGVSVEMFHSSDLQNGFDLVDGKPTDTNLKEQIDARLVALAGLGFDNVNLTFGEFSGVDPAGFVKVLDLAVNEMESVLGAKVSATVHIGGLKSQQVTYMGETLQYYFLVKFTSTDLVPWIHTVMYYDLFEDAGGAYDVDNFDDHRAFLLDRLAKHQSVAYYPEDAYWIAFDDSVPLYLPLYMRSRWLDLSSIRAAAMAQGSPDLDGQVIFSSGWEWGYWQQDRAALRMTYELPKSWEEVVTDEVPPNLKDDVVQLTTLEHDALIGARLAPYLAGRDGYIDAGDNLGIHSQPNRPSFSSVSKLTGAALTTFQNNVLTPLGTLSDLLATVAKSIAAVADPSQPDQAEIADGAQVDADRAHYIHQLYSAAVAKGAGQDPTPFLTAADAALADAATVVARRHSHVPPVYTTDSNNQTVYLFGYLKQADTLCYWHRERLQLQGLVTGMTPTIPSCIN